MNVGEIKQLSCGVIKDVDGDKWTISINYGGAASFTTFKGTMLTFKPQIADAGNYDMCFNITDDNPIPKYKAYLFSVKVNEVKAVVQQMNTTSITSIDITIQLKFETPTSISPKVNLSKTNCNFIGERQHLCQVYQSILLYLGLDKHACQSRN